MAENSGISICEILPVLPDVWEPSIENFHIDADTDFVQKEKERLGITEQITVANKNPKQLFLYNEKLICTDNLEGVIAAYVNKEKPSDAPAHKIEHVFTEPTFLQTGDERIPFVKILGVSFTLGFKFIPAMSDEDRKREGELLIDFILYQVSRFVEELN